MSSNLEGKGIGMKGQRLNPKNVVTHLRSHEGEGVSRGRSLGFGLNGWRRMVVSLPDVGNPEGKLLE